MRKTLLLALTFCFIACEKSETQTETTKELTLEEKVEQLFEDLESKRNRELNDIRKLANAETLRFDFMQLQNQVDSTLSIQMKEIIDSLEVEIEKLEVAVSRIKPSNETIESLFSSVNGSLPSAVDFVKDRMHDPKSFKHVETGWKVLDDGLHVRMKYRGKNAMGATVLEQIDLKTDFKGNVLQQM